MFEGGELKATLVKVRSFIFFDQISFSYCFWLPAITATLFLLGSKEGATGFASGLHFMVIFVDVFSVSGILVFFTHTLRKILRYPIQVILLSVFVIPINFAYFYLRIESSLDIGCVTNSEWFGDILYFSYTTFTTLGYGDMAPVGMCKALTSIEALLGLMSVGAIPGVLIAYLLMRESRAGTPDTKLSDDS